MVRTQIYLTREQQQTLRAMAARTGRKQSELIREAIDEYLARSSESGYRTQLGQGAGLWRDRDDLPDFGAIRAEADRLTRG